MKVKISKKKLIWTAVLLLTAVLVYNLPFLLLKEPVLTQQVRSKLQNYFNKSGFGFAVGKIRWLGGGSFEAQQLALTEPGTGKLFVKADRLVLKTNWAALAKNMTHPELVLREFTVIRPQINLEHYSDQTWNFSPLIKKGNRRPKLDFQVQIREGNLRLDDYRWGKHRLTQVSGKIDFRKYPLVSWQCKGNSDFGKNVALQSTGRVRTDQMVGVGEARFVRLPLKKTLALLPWRYPFELKTGIAKGSIDFAWDRKMFYLQQGQAMVEDSVVQFPWLPHQLKIVSAKTHFTPEQVRVFKSKLSYQKSKLALTGTVDPLRKAVDARLTARGAQLTDMLEVFPAIPNTVIKGKTDFTLRMAGALVSPRFDGKASIYQTNVVTNGEPFSDVNGKLTIKKNNIRVTKAEAIWHEGKVFAQGSIFNIYNPRLDLQVHGNGVVLKQLALVQMLGPEWELCRTADFEGKFTGFWDVPLFTGAARLEQAAFLKVPAQNITGRFEWEPMAMKVRVSELECDLWNGHLKTNGLMAMDDKAANWNMTGRIDGVDLKAINILPDLGLSGTDVAASAVMKGSWRYTDLFEPGTVMGTINAKNLLYQSIPAQEVAAVYNWKQGVFNVDSLLVKTGEGRIFGNLTLEQNRFMARLNAERLKLDSLFPQESLGLAGMFKGSMALEGGFSDFHGTLNGEFSGLACQSKLIGNGTATLEYQQQNQEIRITGLTVDNPSGTYQLAGKVTLAKEAPLAELNLTSDNMKLEGLKKWFPECGKLKLGGEGKATVAIHGVLTNPDFAGTIQLKDFTVSGVKMDTGMVAVQGNLNQVRLTQCELNSPASRLFLTGLVERERLDLTIGGNFANLETLNLKYNGNQLQGKMSLQGKLEGSLTQPVLNAQIRGEKISFGSLEYPVVTADVRWVAPELELYNTQLSGDNHSVRANGKIYTSQPVRFDLGMDVTNFDVRNILKLANLQEFNAAGKFTGKMAISGTAINPKIRLDGGIAEANINSIPVAGELALSYAENKLIFEKIGLLHQSGSFIANGVWEKHKALKLKGRLKQFPLQSLNPLLAAPGVKLAGLADADVQLEWSKSVLRCDYQLDVDNLLVNEEALGQCSLKGMLNETGLTIDSGNTLLKNGQLELTGFIPWTEEIAKNLQLAKPAAETKNELNLRVAFQKVPASFLNMYAIGYRVEDGECNGGLKIGGSLLKPEISGNVECSGVRLELPDLPLLVESVTAAAKIQKNKLTVERAVGNVGKGKVEVGGEVDFSDLRHVNMNLDFKGSRVYFKNFAYDGYSDFDVKLAGEFTDSILMGNINAYNSKMGGLTLMIAKKGKNDWNPRLDLMFNIGKNVRYRQIGVADVSVTGAVHAKGTLVEPTLAGEVNAAQGVVTLYSQTFKVNRAQAVFSHLQGINPYVDVEASLVTPQAMVFMKVKGQVGTEIMPILSSQPAMPQKEIFAMLNWSDLSGDQPLTVDGVVAGNMNMVTDTLLGDIFYEIRNRIGVDYLYLETDYRSNEYKINVGEYLTDKLFVNYTRSIITEKETDDKGKWTFDYHLTPKMAAGGSHSVSDGWAWRLSYTLKF